MGLNSPIDLKMTAAGLAAKDEANNLIFTRFLAGSTGDENSTSVTSIKQVIPINNYVRRIAGQPYTEDGVTKTATDSSLLISGFANSLDAENEYNLNEIALMAKLSENGEEFCFAYDFSNSYKYRIRTDLSQPINVQYKIILTRNPNLVINTSITGVTFTDLYSHTDKAVSASPVHGMKFENGVLTINNIGLSKATVGLGDVDNTSDLDKPVSTAVQTELDGLSDRIDGVVSTATTLDGQIQDLAFDVAEHKNDETNPHNVTAAQVGAAAISHTHVEADISDLGNYAASSHTHSESDITDLGSYASSNHTHTENDITDLGDYATNTDLNSYGVSSLSFDNSTSVLTITMKDNSTKTATITGTGNSGSSGDGSSSGSTVTLQDLGGASATDLTNHTSDTNNPHSVTYTQTGAAAASHTHTESDITDLGSYASSSHTHTTSDITDISNLATATGLNTYGVDTMSFNTSTNVLTLTMKGGTTKTVTIPASSSGNSSSGASVSTITYDDSTNNLVFTFSDNSEVTCNLDDLIENVLTYSPPIAEPEFNSSWDEEMTGTGTALDPYLIYTPRDFMKINDDMSAHYKLMNNLDFTDVIGNEIRVNETANTFTIVPDDEPWNCPMFNGGEGYRPIGYDGYFPISGSEKSTSTFNSNSVSGISTIYGTANTSQYYVFTGELDGNNKIIKGITSIPYNAYSVGLFSFVGNGAHIHHLTIKDSVFVVNDVYCGGEKMSSVASVAGDVCYTVNEINRVQINNVYSYATLISNRQTDGSGDENAKIGGIVCKNKTDSAPSWIINKCSFRGKIIITNSSVRHQVTGIGHYQNWGADSDNQRITNCINTANLPGTYIQGIGQNLGKVNINCGLLPETQNSNHFSLSGHRNTGYVNGKQYTIYDNLTRDADTSESSNNRNNYYFIQENLLKSSDFIIGANMENGAEVFAYNDLGVDDGWPLLVDEYNTLVSLKPSLEISAVDPTVNKIYSTGITINDLTTAINNIPDNALEYKSLDTREYNSEWEDRMTGSGTTVDPYLIYTPKDFVKINEDMTAHYKLMNNLDFAPVTGMTVEISGSGYQIITTDNTAPLYHNGEGFWPIGYNGYFPINSNSELSTTVWEPSVASNYYMINGNSGSFTKDRYIFTGELDGNGKIIKGIACSPINTYAVALFSFLGNNAYIHNFTLKDSVFISNNVYVSNDKESFLASIGSAITSYTSSYAAITINNVYNYATLINGRTTNDGGSSTPYIYTSGICGPVESNSWSSYPVLIKECANHGEILFVDQSLNHKVSGIFNIRPSSNNQLVENCINYVDLYGKNVYGIGSYLKGVNINFGTSSINNGTSRNGISAVSNNSSGSNYVIKSFANLTNWETSYVDGYSDRTSYETARKISFRTLAEFKTQEFVDEANALLASPAFKFNDLNVCDGLPLLIDEYNQYIGVNGNLNLSLIDPLENRVYKSGFSLQELQKVVTHREVSAEITQKFDNYVAEQFAGLKLLSFTITSNEWTAEEEDGGDGTMVPTGNYIKQLSVTGMKVSSPVQLMTQLSDLDIEISAVASNSVTLITNTQPQSDVRVAIMFVP